MSLGTEHSFKYSTNLQGTRLRVRPCRKFIWVSKVIRNWSDYTSIFDWLRGLTPLSKPAKCRTKTNRELVIRVFGSLHASRPQSSHWLSVVTHVFLNDLPDHFQFTFVTFNRKPWHRACRLFRTAKRQFHTFSIWYFQDILSVTVMIKFCRYFFAGRSNPWKMMANPGWIELFDRNSNERLAESKLACRKKKASKQTS